MHTFFDIGRWYHPMCFISFLDYISCYSKGTNIILLTVSECNNIYHQINELLREREDLKWFNMASFFLTKYYYDSLGKYLRLSVQCNLTPSFSSVALA